MKLKNVLIVVEDIQKSKQFYNDLFELEVLAENKGNVILTEGLVLQNKKVWEKYIDKKIITESNSSLIYFEEKNIEDFSKNLERFYPNVKYINKLISLDWGQKMLRFYDLDGNLIEVRTPVN